MSTMSMDGNVPLNVKTSNVVKFFNSSCNTLDLLPMKVATMCWTLGWVCLLVAKVVDSADVVMFHHLSWELDGETWGERQADAHHHCHDCQGPPGLSHNIHVY